MLFSIVIQSPVIKHDALAQRLDAAAWKVQDASNELALVGAEVLSFYPKRP